MKIVLLLFTVLGFVSLASADQCSYNAKESYLANVETSPIPQIDSFESIGSEEAKTLAQQEGYLTGEDLQVLLDLISEHTGPLFVVKSNQFGGSQTEIMFASKGLCLFELSFVIQQE